MIESPYRSRERILCYGGFGAGKSRALLTIARQVPNSTFYIVENDHAYERMLDGPEFRSLNNVELTYVPKTDFEGMATELANAVNKAGKDDWVGFDLFDVTWDAAQEYWTDRIYGVEIDEYFLDVKKRRAENSSEVDRGYVEIDWVTVKKIYAQKIANPIINAKCHMFAANGIKAVSTKDDPDIRRDYSTFRGRPAGNKDAGHWFHTVLILEAKSDGWTFSTVKDREREKAEGEYIDDFAFDYLVKYAGWTDLTPKPQPKTPVRRKTADVQQEA